MAKTKKRLTKSQNKIFLGVFGGIADYFGVDPTLVRVIGLLVFVFTGFFPLGIFYLLAALIMPDYQANNANQDVVQGEFHEK